MDNILSHAKINVEISSFFIIGKSKNTFGYTILCIYTLYIKPQYKKYT